MTDDPTIGPADGLVANTIAIALMQHVGWAPLSVRYGAAHEAIRTVRAWVEAHPVAEPIEELIERSSLGTPAARAMRARITDEQARAVLDRAARPALPQRPDRETQED